ESRCRFYLPILSEYYSYENGLETHTSFIENDDINRLFYRRKSDSSATANLIRILEKHAHGDCLYLNWKVNPFRHFMKHLLAVIYPENVGDEVTSITENQMNIQDLYLTINEESDFVSYRF
ncbi:unnamed protein product, partial [Rotaria magnacalcarata]